MCSSSSDTGRASSAGGREPKRVIVATGNRGKLAEIRTALADTGWEFVTIDEAGGWETPEETGETFVENARIKANAARDLYGGVALADDSGLEVDALDGAPGVYSSRFSGECATDTTNNERLLGVLADVPEGERSARFRCVVVLIDEDGAETLAEGACEGRIGTEPAGDGGFGYDPLFLPEAAPGRSMAQLGMAEKNAISHRGAALKALAEKLK
jgi:XTP/dITP diphosphohydrolase